MWRSAFGQGDKERARERERTIERRKDNLSVYVMATARSTVIDYAKRRIRISMKPKSQKKHRDML